MSFWKIFSGPLIKTFGLVVFSVAIVSGVVYAAANSLAPTAPPAPTSYSLNDIYNKIVYDIEATPGSGSLSSGGTMRTITEVYEAAGNMERGSSGLIIATGQTSSVSTGDDGDLRHGLVRSYTDNGNGTVTDNNTGLMWKQCSETSGGNNCIGTPIKVNWQNAMSRCDNLTFAGHSDWYLPSIRELMSIVDYSRYLPAFNTDYFGVFSSGLPPEGLWSSTFVDYGVMVIPSVMDPSDGVIQAYPPTDSVMVHCVRKL